jgi:hypothetical protein
MVSDAKKSPGSKDSTGKSSKTTAKKTVSAAKKSAKSTPAVKATKKSVAPKAVAKKIPAKTTVVRGTKETAPKTSASKKSMDTAIEATLRELDRQAHEGGINAQGAVELSKFEIEGAQLPAYPQPSEGPLPAPRQLDDIYGDTKIALLARDPEWIFAYWEIGPETREKLKTEYDINNRQMMLRWYDVTDLSEFTGFNAHRVMDIEINGLTISWYQKMPLPTRSWCADLGFVGQSGQFVPICRSQVVSTPRNSLAPARSDEEWMQIEERFFQQIFEASGGFRVPNTLGSEGAAHRNEGVLQEFAMQVGASENAARKK